MMFRLENDVLEINMPQGLTAKQLIEEAEKSFANIEKECYGKDIKVNGRATLGIAMFLGHKLAHISRSVSLFDPKENEFYKVIWH
jgi:hypothetical protein